VERPETRYAIAQDGVYLAYQTAGDGPVDLAWQFDLIFGNVEMMWETVLGAWLREISSFTRLILHDRRGTGLSSRSVPPPNLETRVADLEVVLDAVHSERPVIGGYGDGGASNVLFAASRPDRIRSMVWSQPTPRTTWAPDFPQGRDRELVERSVELTANSWGSEGYGAAFAELEAAVGNDMPPELVAMMGRLSRSTATPEVAVMIDQIWNETDVRAILPSVTVPTLLLDSDQANLDAVASMMPGAEVRILPGGWAEFEVAEIGHIREWLGVRPPVVDIDRVLSTIVFTDIVGSTARAAELGDARWKDVLAAHDELARTEIERHRGTLVNTTGDGLLATFDGPARAVRCAQAIGEAVRSLDIEIRAGCHTGEVVLVGQDVQGLSVHIGARVAALAGASQVLVSSTVKDLVAGSGLTFEDLGMHELKGVPDRWHLYAVSSG
jgi:class 3 adenylate cyclase/pimeloyl-ACP methyl ester carboxylesterase